MKKKAFFGILFICVSFIISGQDFDRMDFFEADMLLLEKNYQSAQKIYEKLLKSEPDNANLNFLNGLCLVNIPGRKKEAVEFLEKAVPFASEDYKYGSPKETNAPLEVIKYYALANKMDGNIPKAIELLNEYLSVLGNDDEEMEVVNRLLESCNTAQRMIANPVFYEKSDLGTATLSEMSKQYPVVNYDETMLFFSVEGKYKDDIYFSEKVDGDWTEAVKITAHLGLKSEGFPTSVSFDEERLYLTVRTGTTTDIYYSFRKNGRWQKMLKLDKSINTRDWESDACESPDGKYLYFASDRKGGLGAMDIYRSEKDEKGRWDKPVNLGPKINTPLNEIMPIVNKDNSKLFFKSEGHENIGGYDIFYVLNTGNKEWGDPVNLGYPINTTDDDIHYIPAGAGNCGYVSLSDPAHNGNLNIYHIEILKEDPYKKFNISGRVTLGDGTTDYRDITIEIISTETYEQIFSLMPHETNGNFTFELGRGKYMINVVKPDYDMYTDLVDLTSYKEDNYMINPVLESTATVVEQTEVTEIIPEEVPPAEEQPENSPEDFSPVPEEQTVSVPEEQINNDTSGEAEIPLCTSVNAHYTIQIMASYQQIDPADMDPSLSIEIQKGEDDYYRYITGVFNTLAEAESIKNEIILTKYKDAFIRYYTLDDYLNNPVRPVTYTIQVMALKKEIDLNTFKYLSDIKVSFGNDQIYRYTAGEYPSILSARKKLQEIMSLGYETAFIRQTSGISNY
ncbi:MAG: hypothetical protein PVF73_04530 [Bacteroidales bacterium]|jgi:tetratricopeptide (TPR) repeat protein